MQPNHPLSRFVKSFVSFINNEQVIKSRPLRGITGKFNRSLKEIHIKKDDEGIISGYLIHNKRKFEIAVTKETITIGSSFPTEIKVTDVSGLNHYLERLYNTN